MGILSLFAKKPTPPEDTVPITAKSSTYRHTLKDSEQNSVVYACVDLISSSIAAMGVHVYERRPDGRIKRPDHPAYRLIHEVPNQYNSPYVFKRQILIDCLTHGNFFALIEKRGSKPTALYRIDPARIKEVKFDSAGIYYEVKLENDKVIFYSEEIIHIQGFSFDSPFQGDSVLKSAAGTISLATSAERLAESFFQQGILGGTTLQHPNKLNKVQREILKKDIDNASGLNNAFSFLLLEDGMKLDKLSIDLEKLQFMGLMEYSVADICRFFAVPKLLVNVTEGTSQYGVGETLYSIFWKDCLRKWAILIEEELSRKLLREDEKQNLYIEVDNNSLLRGDPASEQTILINYVSSGIMTTDEARQKLNLPPLPKEQSVPQPAYELAKTKILEDISSRVKTKEELALRKAVKRSREDFDKWTEEFYQSQLDTIDKYVDGYREILSIEEISDLKKKLVFARVEQLDKQLEENNDLKNLLGEMNEE